jgi:hypothetical protein
MFKKWFTKKSIMPITVPTPAPIINPAGNITISAALGAAPYTMNSSMMAGGALIGAANYSYNTITTTPYVGAAGAGGTFTIGTNLHNATSVVSFYKGSGGSEIVRLNRDGTITWANGIDVDEAADAFGRAIALGAEMQAGITEGTKRRMRDSVFADLIDIAKEKGSLTADDLTYLLEASKIMEKLKGGRE